MSGSFKIEGNGRGEREYGAIRATNRNTSRTAKLSPTATVTDCGDMPRPPTASSGANSCGVELTPTPLEPVARVMEVSSWDGRRADTVGIGALLFISHDVYFVF